MKRKIILTTIIGIATMLAITTKVQANLQSKPGAPALNATVSDFFIKSRNMEGPNESFGLSATINQDTGAESASNGIDVHMVKNTEYGAAIILGSSAYGGITSSTAADQQVSPNTLTGNNTGMIMNESTRWTYTASYITGGMNSYVTKMIASSQRYWNSYAGTTPATHYKKGDATTEMTGWRNAGNATWSRPSAGVFGRGVSGVFSFYPDFGNAHSHFGSRVVAVVSPGI